MVACIRPLFALLVASGAVGVEGRARAAVAQPPALNHVYVVLDAATFVAVRDSAWVRESLTRADAGLPDFATPSADSDRMFLRGRHTYLELLAPDNRFDEPVGKVGIAMGFDDGDGLSELEHTWRGAYADDVRRSDVVFRRRQPPVPWYRAIQRDTTADNPHLVVWAMTHAPEFVQWQSSGKAQPGSTRRADVLADRRGPGQALLDVVGIVVGVPEPLHDALVEQFRLAGFEYEDTPQGTRLTGRDWRIVLRADSEAPGMESIELRVRSETHVVCRPLGTTRLATTGPDVLRWHFAADTSGSDTHCARSGSRHASAIDRDPAPHGRDVPPSAPSGRANAFHPDQESP